MAAPGVMSCVYLRFIQRNLPINVLIIKVARLLMYVQYNNDDGCVGVMQVHVENSSREMYSLIRRHIENN